VGIRKVVAAAVAVSGDRRPTHPLASNGCALLLLLLLLLVMLLLLLLTA